MAIGISGGLRAIGALAIGGIAFGAHGEGDGWRDFSGTWNPTGTVHVLDLGSRSAALGDLSGTLLLSGPSRPGIGFRGEAIAFSDTETGMVGRAVWTDERGDQVFSELRGDGPRKGGKVSGTFIGGTGRYAGATGTYDFTWQYVINTDDGVVQGHVTDLKGRVRSEWSVRADQGSGGKP
jgi:hypothetical protein